MQDRTKLQTSRFEYKYLISEGTAEAIRRFVSAYLPPDTYTASCPGAGYPVHSLYLDSPDLKLCQQTICGEKNRVKLRIRFYDDRPDHPVFLETKRRVYDVIVKQRVAVWRSAVPNLLSDYLATRSYLYQESEPSDRALRDFCELARTIDARPAAYTSYDREAYEPADNNFCRVTFDRNIRAGEFQRLLTVADRDQWPLVPFRGVVFELKFTDRFPDWMGILVETFDLQRISVPKYVECMNVVEASIARRQQTEQRIFVDRPLHLVAPQMDVP
ncbi:MAG: VTC domain-containing protein [Pirellulales bacterium]